MPPNIYSVSPRGAPCPQYVVRSIHPVFRILPQRGQRPVLHAFGQRQRPQEVTQVVGQREELQPFLPIIFSANYQKNSWPTPKGFLTVQILFSISSGWFLLTGEGESRAVVTRGGGSGGILVSSRAISFSMVLAVFIIYGCGSSSPGGEDQAVRAYLDGDFKKAEKHLRAEIAAGPVRSSRHLLLGRVCFLQKNWDAAGKALKILLEQDPDNPQGRELMGRTLFRQGHLKKAEKYYQESLDAAPRAELRLEYGELFIGLGRKPEAILQLKKVMEDGRRWPRAHYLMGSLRLASGQGHWAARHLWVAYKLGCPEKDLIEKLPRAFFLEGRVTGPLQLVGPLDKEARAGDRTEKHLLLRNAGPGRVGYWYAAGPDTAIYQAELAWAASAQQKSNSSMQLLVARCWLLAGNLQMAAGRARGINSGTLAGFRLLAEIALSSGDLKAFEGLRKKPPGNTPEVREVLTQLTLRAALIAQVEGQLKKALALLEAADLLTPGRSEVLRPTIDVLERLGRGAEAAARARLLIELHPDSPEIRLIAARYRIDGEKVEQGPIIKDDPGEPIPGRDSRPRRGEL